MASIDIKEEYLRMVGNLGAYKIEGFGDDVWTAFIAYLFSDGFIKEIDWTSPMGQMFSNVLDEHFSKE